MNLEARPWPVDFQATAAPRCSSPFFSWLQNLQFLPLGCSWWFERFFTGCGTVLITSFSRSPAGTPPLCAGPGSGCSRRYLRRRTAVFSCLSNFALLTPSSAQSRGATGEPCSRTTWYRAIYVTVCYLIFFCVLYLFYLFRPFKTLLPLAGLEEVSPSIPGICRFLI